MSQSCKELELAYEAVLKATGENVTREGLLETPKRAAKAFAELTQGYGVEIKSLFKTFEPEGSDQMVVLAKVPFSSLCEHHLLPFSGHASVGYLPGAKIIGLSKMARLVNAYSRRLQVQERLTQQIALAMMENLSPLGVAVVVTASHTCMGMRGAKSEGCMVTSAMLGAFRESSAARQEFLSLIK